MDRRQFLKNLIHVPTPTPINFTKGKMLIDGDVDIRGNLRVYSKTASSPMFTVCPDTNFAPSRMFPFNPVVIPVVPKETESYRLVVGDKANG